jgi:hypothetical protein
MSGILRGFYASHHTATVMVVDGEVVVNGMDNVGYMQRLRMVEGASLLGIRVSGHESCGWWSKCPDPDVCEAVFCQVFPLKRIRGQTEQN